jgi:hypothetical protein
MAYPSSLRCIHLREISIGIDIDELVMTVLVKCSPDKYITAFKFVLLTHVTSFNMQDDVSNPRTRLWGRFGAAAA